MDRAVWDLLWDVDWAEQGMPPVAGGSHDQTHAFMAALRLIRNERTRIENARRRRARPH